MKFAILASFAVHVGGLALLPGDEPEAPRSAESIAAECRCDYELTVTATQAPRALTLGAAPDGRFAR